MNYYEKRYAKGPQCLGGCLRTTTRSSGICFACERSKGRSAPVKRCHCGNRVRHKADLECTFCKKVSSSICRYCGVPKKRTPEGISSYQCSCRKCSCGADKARSDRDLCFNCKPLDSRRSGPRRVRVTNRDGYILVDAKNHPYRNAHNRVFEHRLVMEASIGRYLTPEETVHHKNGVRDDNRIENLELWCKSHHPGQRVVDQISWAMMILTSHGYEVRKKPRKTGLSNQTAGLFDSEGV